MNAYTYIGGELDTFARAVNWKSYLAASVERFIGGDVLEVGAGLGATTLFLCRKDVSSWTCLEPDEALATRLRQTFALASLPVRPAVLTSRLRDIPVTRTYDCILYVDVLEHIQDDARELEAASELLRTGGYLIVISPAHQWLYSAFDEAIGHYRRYSRGTLSAVGPSDTSRAMLRYLDSVGAILSAANRWLLRSPTPTPRQIWFWDHFVVPTSRVLDPLFGYRVGKTIVGVWRADRRH